MKLLTVYSVFVRNGISLPVYKGSAIGLVIIILFPSLAMKLSIAEMVCSGSSYTVALKEGEEKGVRNVTEQRGFPPILFAVELLTENRIKVIKTGYNQVSVKESESGSEVRLSQEGATLPPGGVVIVHSIVDSQVISFEYQIRQRTIQEVQQTQHKAEKKLAALNNLLSKRLRSQIEFGVESTEEPVQKQKKVEKEKWIYVVARFQNPPNQLELRHSTLTGTLKRSASLNSTTLALYTYHGFFDQTEESDWIEVENISQGGLIKSAVNRAKAVLLGAQLSRLPLEVGKSHHISYLSNQCDLSHGEWIELCLWVEQQDWEDFQLQEMCTQLCQIAKVMEDSKSSFTCLFNRLLTSIKDSTLLKLLIVELGRVFEREHPTLWEKSVPVYHQLYPVDLSESSEQNVEYVAPPYLTNQQPSPAC